MGNDTGDEVGILVSALRWTQVAGKDVYAPADDLIASPPIFMLEPHGKQLIRLGLRRRTPGAAYRVIVEEIPNEKASGTGIKVALRLNLPLYIERSEEHTSELQTLMSSTNAVSCLQKKILQHKTARISYRTHTSNTKQ